MRIEKNSKREWKQFSWFFVFCVLVPLTFHVLYKYGINPVDKYITYLALRKQPETTTKVTPKAEKPKTKAHTRPPVHKKTMVDRLERGIKHKLREAPRRPLYKNRDMRIDLSKMIALAAVTQDFDPFLILNMAFREGSLRVDAEGDMNEVGTMQVHGVAKRYCEKAGFDLEDLSDQIHCGAYYLRILADDCGGLICALNAYASGNYKPKKKVVNNSKGRLAEAAELSHLSKELSK